VVNGVRLWFRVAGQGGEAPPVVFLHGGPGYNSHSFAELAGRRLEPHAMMIYLDQRGCGRSERPWDGDYALDTLVADLEALRRELGVTRWVLLGHSFGGTLALEYAARFPDQVAGLILVGAFSDAASTYAEWERELADRFPELADGTGGSAYDRVTHALAERDAAAFFGELQFVDARHRERQDAVDARSGLRNTGELARAMFGGPLRTYAFTAFDQIRAPALVIAGRHDRSIGLASQRALAERLPKARWSELAESAHFPYLEEPDRFTREVLEFLTALGRAAPAE